MTPIPGTTRDLIEETLDIQGLPVVIADTAGLHRTEDPIEAIGIQKTRAYIQDSDLVLFLVDAGCPLSDADFEICNAVQGKTAVLVINKMDLLKEPRAYPIPEAWEMPSVMKSACRRVPTIPLSSVKRRERRCASVISVLKGGRKGNFPSVWKPAPRGHSMQGPWTN